MPNERSFADACRNAANGPWGELEFFSREAALTVGRLVDERIAAGAEVLPRAVDVFNALTLTPPDKVRAVILGQDPYPTPGDAHGLAFSVANRSRRLPGSLKTIFQSLTNDLGSAAPESGDLTPWARSGVLLLNCTLTVEAGLANSHKTLGWQQLASEVVAHLNRGQRRIVFMLWGKFAQQAAGELDDTRHCVIRCAHPSPLARGSGLEHPFLKAKPFATAQQWCRKCSLPPIDWRL